MLLREVSVTTPSCVGVFVQALPRWTDALVQTRAH